MIFHSETIEGHWGWFKKDLRGVMYITRLSTSRFAITFHGDRHFMDNLFKMKDTINKNNKQKNLMWMITKKEIILMINK